MNPGEGLLVSQKNMAAQTLNPYARTGSLGQKDSLDVGCGQATFVDIKM